MATPSPCAVKLTASPAREAAPNRPIAIASASSIPRRSSARRSRCSEASPPPSSARSPSAGTSARQPSSPQSTRPPGCAASNSQRCPPSSLTISSRSPAAIGTTSAPPAGTKWRSSAGPSPKAAGLRAREGTGGPGRNRLSGGNSIPGLDPWKKSGGDQPPRSGEGQVRRADRLPSSRRAHPSTACGAARPWFR
jgi:hypothetical protein